MKKIWYLPLAVLALAGCSEKNEGQEPVIEPETSVWDYAQKDYLLLKGDVATVNEMVVTDASDPENTETMTILQMELNSTGQVTFYNPIWGTDPREDMQAAPMTRDWGVADKAYAYSYDAGGRMNSATEYTIGDVNTTNYAITYGNHGLYVPAPFPVMDKPIWLLRSVAQVTGGTDFSLVCNGKTVVIDYPPTWNGGRVHAVYTYEGIYPAQCVAVTSRNGETLSTSTTTYTWTSNGGLLKTSEKIEQPEEEDQLIVTDYSTKFLLSPVKKSLTIGETLDSELAYDYYEDGLIAAERYARGNGFGQPYSRSYSDQDSHGNWRKGVLTLDDTMDNPVIRTITYR